MATTKEIKRHLAIALKEIGKIEPWFDRKFKAWIFSHPKYPVEYAGDSAQEVIKKYPLYLRDFIEERLNDNLAPHVEKATKGLAGKRPRTSHSKVKQRKTVSQISLPTDIANWFYEYPTKAISSVRQLIAKTR